MMKRVLILPTLHHQHTANSTGFSGQFSTYFTIIQFVAQQCWPCVSCRYVSAVLTADTLGHERMLWGEATPSHRKHETSGVTAQIE
jgi:hypothetical protein